MEGDAGIEPAAFDSGDHRMAFTSIFLTLLKPLEI